MTAKALSVLRGLLMTAACFCATIFAAHVALCQEVKPAPDRQDAPQDSANKRQLAVMRTLADTIEVTVGEGEQRKEVELTPSLCFASAIRHGCTPTDRSGRQFGMERAAI